MSKARVRPLGCFVSYPSDSLRGTSRRRVACAWSATRFVMCAAGLAAVFSTVAAAQDEEQTYSTLAVQNRAYDSTHEFGAHLGILPLDAFTKGATVSGTYTIHFTHLLAWEVLHGLKSFHFDSDLAGDLEQLSVAPTPFEVLDWFVTSNLLIKPIYWKGSWFNKSVVRGEIMFALGGGYANYTRTGRALVDLGMVFRVYLNKLFSLRLDARHHIIFEDSIFSGFNLDHELWIALGTSLSF